MNRDLLALLVAAVLLGAAVGVVCDLVVQCYIAHSNADLRYAPGPKLDGGPVPEGPP